MGEIEEIELKGNLSYIGIFFRYAKWRIIPLFLGILTAGFLEGIGITLFIPLLSSLNMPSGGGGVAKKIGAVFSFFHLDITLTSVLVFIGLVFVLKFFVLVGHGVISRWLSKYLTLRLQEELMDKFMSLDYLYYVRTKSGYFVNLITREVDKATAGFKHFCKLLIIIVYIFVYIFLSFLISWKVTLASGLGGLFVIVAFKGIYKKARKYSINISEMLAQLNSELIQFVYSFKYLKATNTYLFAKPKMLKNVGRLALYYFKQGILAVVSNNLSEPVIVIFLALLVYVNVILLKNDISSVLVVFLVFYRSMHKILQFQGSYQIFNNNIGGLVSLKKSFAEFESNKEFEGKIKLREFERAITFNNVYFSYNSNSQVLKGVSLTIKKGQMVAIVGKSGVGKTTIVDMIAGLILPESGIVAIDGIDYRKIDLSFLREKIGYVTQDPILFNDSILNNIVLGREFNRDKLEVVLRRSYSYEFVKALPNKENTLIGERGVFLSGGQRQRLVIARELYKEPEILLLDEATSNLDSESEFYIQQAISELKGECTMVIVAHRLSTIKIADVIYVLDDGKLVESGSFQNLSCKDGIFRQMYTRQSF